MANCNTLPTVLLTAIIPDPVFIKDLFRDFLHNGSIPATAEVCTFYFQCLSDFFISACWCLCVLQLLYYHYVSSFFGQSWVNDAASEKLRQQIVLSDNDNGMVGCKAKYGG